MTLQRVDEQYRGLTYPWGRLEHPGDDPFEVAPGVWWVRFTMPGPLNHINLWLLEDGDGWTIVDTCLNLDSAKAHWEALFDGFMEGKPVHRVICTHMHPDHIGLAGWLCERFARSNSAIAFFSPPTASTGSKSFSSPSFNTIMLLDDE